MIKIFNHNEKHLKCAGASLSLQIMLLVLTTSIPEGAGGSDEGDPAPGRSPGPPLHGYETSGEAAEISFDVVRAGSKVSSWCRNHFASTNSSGLNVTFHHPIFGVFTKLLPGLVYHVSISNKDPIEEIYASSVVDNIPVGTWINESVGKVCEDGLWTSLGARESVRWSYAAPESSNLTFRFRYRLSPGNLFEESFAYAPAAECSLKLRRTRGSFGSGELPNMPTCRVVFPEKARESSFEHKEGLLIELTRLNVPCSGGGFIQFVEETNDLKEESYLAPRKLCGKLEELSSVERKLYFPSFLESKRPYLLVHKNPVFSLNYHLVDYCYNVTFVSRNGSLVLNPVENLLCHFSVHLPYGNRVLLRLQMGEDKVMTTTQFHSDKAQNVGDLRKLKLSSLNNTLKKTGNVDSSLTTNNVWEEESEECDGLFVTVWDGSLTWNHCSRHGDPKRDIQVWSRENIVTIKIVTRALKADMSDYAVVKFWYHAEPVDEIVGTCEFGEVLVKRFCVSSVQIRLNWSDAEEFCEKRGGHLASIGDETSQNIIDNLLLNGPEYKEENSYWIGASDEIYEGYFRWTDGSAFSYSNWFPGWSQQGFYNRQPNDDGFSHQDCVEIRRIFPHPTGTRITDGVTASYLWNDLDCKAENYFLCERPESGESSEEPWNQKCNKTITLSREHPKATVVSSGFPHQYPDNVRCETIVVAPSGFRLIIDFEELVIEKEPSCSYDYLELIEDSWNGSYVAKRLCGDMSDKLKLFRYTSQGSRLKFLFVSDYSHHFGGFKAKISMESAKTECADERYEMFNNSCYLFVNYPKVTWDTASQICSGMKAVLASVLSPEEEGFITGNIRNSIEYSTSAMFWLGGHFHSFEGWRWIDGSPMEFTAWSANESSQAMTKDAENVCLSIQWLTSNAKALGAGGLYWTPQRCQKVGGYVCKIGNQASGVTLNLNRTLNGTEGHLLSPGYPGPYYNNLDYYIHLVGPVWTRMVLLFTKIDLEEQAECLYDFIEVKSGDADEAQVRWCGNKSFKKNRLLFVSDNSEAILRFHSDYSVTRAGFFARWKAVDVTGCPSQELTAREGVISSPNFGEFLLPQLDCTTTVLAPPGKRIWMKFSDINLKDDSQERGTWLEVDLGGGVKPFEIVKSQHLTAENFVSFNEKLTLRLKTSGDPTGNGFRAAYRIENLLEGEEVIELRPNNSGVLHHLNYPAPPPPNVDFVQHLIAPFGYVVTLEMYQATLAGSDKTCPDGSGVIEITDSYADDNGTGWVLCEDKGEMQSSPSLSITSYFNRIHVRQRGLSVGARLKAAVTVQMDAELKLKLSRISEGIVESCRPNPCQNGGKCLNIRSKQMCQCVGHFTGIFCALTHCELEPCSFGECELTANGYRCHCQIGYTGPSCEKKQSPCEDNPCEGRGECSEKGGTFHCRCHAWWEGPRCEKRMTHIPFKPLSERMLQEPFWLGLITVFVVLGIIGLVWCAKRHFPEKLEKLLADEAERHNRSSVSGIIRPPSVREQIHPPSGSVTTNNNPSTGNCPRTLFGRLGIRKSSLLSLTSPQRPERATSRTFSLDDLLRPPPRRTPSPRKKPSNSTTPKRNPAEKKQILQQLICPLTSQLTVEKLETNEPIQMKECKRKSLPLEKSDWKETSFIVPTTAAESKADFSKLEKKVTFARLLNKVSAEMSSGSEAETCNLAVMKALSTPVSPALDRRCTPSVSSNQGSDSLSSSEIAISGSTFNSMLDIPGSTKRPSRLSYKGCKNISADSILDMFRSFTSTSVTSERKEVTPSSTPTAPSPQEERMISEDSSMVETPVSTTSGPTDSPVGRMAYGVTIEVPVMDPLTAQKTAHVSPDSNFLQPPSILLEIPSGGNNKFLSPIREVPTPMSSPALTPVMTRVDYKTIRASASESSDDEAEIKCCKDDEDSEDFSEVLIQVHREDNDDDMLSPIEERLICRDLPPPSNKKSNFLVKASGSEHPNMIIPLLTVQEPSPPSTSPPLYFLGSPPPQKAFQPFMYSAASTSQRLIKRPDKPNSLELPYPPPMITITCNASEPESDAESISPAPKSQNLGSLNPTINSVEMSYLSPFSMSSRADRTVSESNLSSSGYSSMASPGPSRCGSNNPLCLSEIEDHQRSQSQPPSRRPSPLLRTPSGDDRQAGEVKQRGRSDSETLSDDPLMESNDEGIGTDHLDERLEDKEVKTMRNLELFLIKDQMEDINYGSLLVPSSSQRAPLRKRDNSDSIGSVTPATKASLQLPTIVVQSDYSDKLLSPVSSRSESPLSDKALGLGRFSPLFYGKSKCDHLPFTDSDGLYDFPSSDCPLSSNKSVQAGTTSHRKSTGRRRERRHSYRLTASGSKTSSPTKGHDGLLDVPQRDAPGHRTIAQRKPSPKRRIRTQQPVTSSSSTESLPSPDVMNENRRREPEGSRLTAADEGSAEDTTEEIPDVTKESQKDELPPAKRIIAFKTIGHQIRFLRRIELSLRRKEKRMSYPPDSEDDEDADDPSLSLLPRELRKSNSIGIMPHAAPQKRRETKKRGFGSGHPRLSHKHDPLSVMHGQTD